MKKQVLAILLATLLILTTFAACGKKYLIYTDKDGVEHPVLTDAEGNTMVNEFGQIVVGVTDSHGNLVTDENGENETRAVVFPSVIAQNNVYETPDFKLTVPEGLWTVTESGLQKKGSEIQVEISAYQQPDNLEQQEQQNDSFLQYLQTHNMKVEATKETIALQNSISVLHYSVKHYDEEDNLTQGQEIYYFQRGDTIYAFVATEPADEIGTVRYVDILNMIKFRT